MSGSNPHAIGIDVSTASFRAAHWIVLLAITALAAALRLHGLGDWAFWVDEAHTWRDATLPNEIFWSCNRGWYPTSYVILRWMLDFADHDTLHEGLLRLPFAIAGILSVPLLAWAGRPMIGIPAALFAALLLAIDPWHIYWSQNARGYALLFLFATISLGFYWRGIERMRRQDVLLAMLAGMVGVSCQPTAGLAFAAMVAFPLLADRIWNARLLGILVALVAASFLVAPLLRYVPPFHEFMLAKSTPDLPHLAQTVAFYFRLPVLLLAVVGAWAMWQARDRKAPLLLALWTALPLLALAILGSSVLKATARYALCALPSALVLAAVGAMQLRAAADRAYDSSGRALRRLPGIAVAALVCIDLLVYDYHYFTVQHGDRGLWQVAAARIHDLSPEGNVTVLTVNEPTMHFYLRRWHYSGNEKRIAQMPREVVSIETYELARSGGAPEWFLSQVTRAQAAGRDLYAVITLPELREKDPDGRLERSIQSGMDLVAAYPMSVGPKDETIFVYRARAAK